MIELVCYDVPSQGETNVLGHMLEKNTLKLLAQIATHADFILFRMFLHVCRDTRTGN